ncbi:DNA adenine methylase [Pseudomonas sp. GZJR-8]|uniref:DNA adenine methylase n=1 Tax=Pseudomonas sp. GZJR-8 TaxID=1395925 RepID=UPI000CDACA9B|nr:DNA adenine methylase [Pseudomonas sp. GZJR-8]
MTYITAPHVIPYQGSKRKLASAILSFFPDTVRCLYEPFAGSAAITLAAAANGRAEKFLIGDKLEPLAKLWQEIIDNPIELSEKYNTLWQGQLDDPAEFFLATRESYNSTQSPCELLYLIARCVKNSVRFNNSGKFNQGADKRRLGLKPQKILKEAKLASALLKGKTSIVSGDFRDMIKSAGTEDLIYMDPPWQGTSGKRDPRYAFLLDIDELESELDSLNDRGVPYILSFDGTCGDKNYGRALAPHLSLTKVELNAGRSTQATLLGRDHVTIESLYLSPALEKKLSHNHPITKYQRKMKIQSDLFELS